MSVVKIVLFVVLGLFKNTVACTLCFVIICCAIKSFATDLFTILGIIQYGDYLRARLAHLHYATPTNHCLLFLH